MHFSSSFLGSPIPSPEKQSPNKSPPQTAVLKGSGFNPNAPTFVPMALQRTNPNVSVHSVIFLRVVLRINGVMQKFTPYALQILAERVRKLGLAIDIIDSLLNIIENSMQPLHGLCHLKFLCNTHESCIPKFSLQGLTRT